MTAVRERPAPTVGAGAARRSPARKAVIRWGWRLFRREWRRQVLILALLVVAIGATVVGLGAASNTSILKADPTYGTANTILALPGSDPGLAADMAAIRATFGPVDVITHQQVPVPGSVSTVDLRSQDPKGPYGRVMLRLDSGRYPTATGEVAVTSDVATTFGLQIGSIWNEDGQHLRVVGRVENPLNLLDGFALLAPGQSAGATDVSFLVDTNQQTLQSFRLPSGIGLTSGGRGTTPKAAVEALVLAMSTLGLLFVGLLAVAGFTVMAQRRLRSLGVLGSIGATDRQVRLVLLANGAAVGGTAAVVGTGAGLAAWFAFVPTLRSVTEHRVDAFALPWWAIGASMLLTLITAVAAAWWPARTATRTSIVAALSGRPPRPQPAHRFAALGTVLLALGILLLAFSHQHRAAFIIGGTVATPIGLLLFAPLAIRALAWAGQRTTIAVRLALRDLARYQARSGAALGAVTLSIGIAATIAISAAAAETPTGAGNLPPNELMLYITPGPVGSPLPPLTAAQLAAAAAGAQRLAGAIQATSVLRLDQAYDPQGPTEPAQTGSSGRAPGGYDTASMARVTADGRGEQVSFVAPLYVATPAVLAHYGIPMAALRPGVEVLSSRSDLGGLQIFDPSGRGPDQSPAMRDPAIQLTGRLPVFSSDPTSLLTEQALHMLGLQTAPAAWLVQADHPLTKAQIATATRVASEVGLYVEARKAQKSQAPLRNWSTAAGILLALGVLGMTVGLIRSETANDLRTLAATGASGTTRRALTGVTSGALALLGGLLGTAGAYAALVAWHRSDLTPLDRVPWANLVIIVAGLPLVAAVAGWLLAGAEPPVIARRPLE